jgi:c-di-GMP-binding flagellar brake protein YcgR
MRTERHLLNDVELSERPRSPFEDQRRASRRAMRLVAEIRLPNGNLLRGQTADISRSGIGFFCPERIDIGGDCTLMIRISACGTDAELKLIGRVCHCTKQSEDSYRIGMQFIRMDEQTAAILCTALR